MQKGGVDTEGQHPLVGVLKGESDILIVENLTNKLSEELHLV